MRAPRKGAIRRAGAGLEGVALTGDEREDLAAKLRSLFGMGPPGDPWRRNMAEQVGRRAKVEGIVILTARQLEAIRFDAAHPLYEPSVEPGYLIDHDAMPPKVTHQRNPDTGKWEPWP